MSEPTKWTRHIIGGSPYTVLVPVSTDGDGASEMLEKYYAIDDVQIYDLDEMDHVFFSWGKTVAEICSEHFIKPKVFHTLVKARPEFAPRIIDGDGRRVKCEQCKKDFQWTSRNGLVRTLKGLHKFAWAICKSCDRQLNEPVTSKVKEPPKPWVLNPEQIAAVRGKAKGWATYEALSPRVSICRCCGENIAKQTPRLTFVLPTPPEATGKNRYTRWGHVHLNCHTAVVPVQEKGSAA